MLDDYKEKQQIAYKILLNTIEREKNFHAYLIETNGNKEGISIALAFAKALLCPKKKTRRENCDNCQQCTIIDDGNSLEIKIINPDGMWIRKDQITSLQQEFTRKAVIGDKKIYIINEVEKLNLSSANSLLKFLEEPEDNIIAILLTDNIYQVLETIISRCLIIPLNNNFNKNTTLMNDLAERLKIINGEEDIQKFIDSVINFTIYYEQNGTHTIGHYPILLGNIIESREKTELFFDTMILVYREVLILKSSNKVKEMPNFLEKLIKISNLTNSSKICDRIRIINNFKNQLKVNANINLLIDNLIIKMEGDK